MNGGSYKGSRPRPFDVRGNRQPSATTTNAETKHQTNAKVAEHG